MLHVSDKLMFMCLLLSFQNVLLTTTCAVSPTASYAPSIAPTTAYPTQIPTTASPSARPSAAPVGPTGGDEISAGGGLAVGLISALGVGGLAIVVTAYVVQKKRMAKAYAIPEMVSEVSINEV